MTKKFLSLALFYITIITCQVFNSAAQTNPPPVFNPQVKFLVIDSSTGKLVDKTILSVYSVTNYNNISYRNTQLCKKIGDSCGQNDFLWVFTNNSSVIFTIAKAHYDVIEKPIAKTNHNDRVLPYLLFLVPNEIHILMGPPLKPQN